ncbi:hypothetical protein A2634_02250 [Candidatus Amesbacteria bacterium RIFCSPHIGHO2_01_FULL_48_32]|uniref:PIN domain-containing protein n=1 Tax=Candidatus Amesbacteria bacterium RIFCSPLOWO2_01_FULL_48_25 TaxID=1797259 RepID=A0A1F4ZFJ9_9BACT|nr:MAG: hypothetical protein A2634_02250 [Candidatus Amesbacteria bacterium RIFCSPHIGHO2_01_FULL_48_32]OGD04407.1 MAG: hypothetical protein A2989_05255 [Candidatus Amesbacteria bacterium RIFCSPLOWO2_01_FULL_48_25]HJZ06247.1 type II toxin-antitoxin system VapC family toxin [Patescibacteria group bacterium]
MITKVVIDTNVVLKWIPGKNEEGVGMARKIYGYIKKKDVEMWAPEYMLLESLQVFVRKRLMKLDEAIEGVELLRNCGLIFEQIGVESFTEIAGISQKFDQSVYDSMFLYLAKKRNCKLITFDEKVWKRCELAINPKEFLEMVEI